MPKEFAQENFHFLLDSSRKGQYERIQENDNGDIDADNFVLKAERT